jgi:hypothetical protein
MESARTELSPAAAKLIHEALVVQRPHLHRVFADRHHVLAGGIPAHRIDTLSVALQFFKKIRLSGLILKGCLVSRD